MSPRVVLTAAGGALLVLAPVLLLLTGNTDIVTSSDEGAAARPLWTAVAPVAAGLLLARLVPPRLPEHPVERWPTIRREAAWLVAAAVAFPLAVAFLGAQTLWYPVVKVALLLGVPLLVARHRPAFRSARWYPWPALLAWGALAFAVPTDLTPYEELDPVVLWVGAAITLLTAGLLEEWFYRVTLQTRLEALYGRRSAIVVTALLFSVMHLPSHLHTDRPWVAVAAMLAFQGLFGVFVGYLWSRYRAAWAIMLVHAAVNGLPLLPIAFRG